MFDPGGAREQTADESRAGRSAGRFEPAVSAESISISPAISPRVDCSGLPNGSGNSGRLPSQFSANSIQARTSGESAVRSAVQSRSWRQNSSKLPAGGSAMGCPLATSEEYIPCASSIVIPISAASPWT